MTETGGCHWRVPVVTMHHYVQIMECIFALQNYFQFPSVGLYMYTSRASSSTWLKTIAALSMPILWRDNLVELLSLCRLMVPAASPASCWFYHEERSHRGPIRSQRSQENYKERSRPAQAPIRSSRLRYTVVSKPILHRSDFCASPWGCLINHFVKELLVRASSSVEFISFQIIQQVIVVVLAVFSGFFIFDKINKVNSKFYRMQI